jgi:uroporphyrinogen-III decarboxylase
MCKVTLSHIRRFTYDAALLFRSEVTVISDVVTGCKVSYMNTDLTE